LSIKVGGRGKTPSGRKRSGKGRASENSEQGKRRFVSQKNLNPDATVELLERVEQVENVE
jgi:hypothetical protein